MGQDAPAAGMSDQQFKEYMRFVKDNAQKSGGDKLDTGDLKAKFEKLQYEAGKAADTIKDFSVDSYRSFQNLSKSGANFSGDLIGMTAAAYNSRLNLADFSQVIKENSQNLTGLGGNVTRGAEAFARLSKSFFDDKASQELRNLGYTSKDLNEILALQVGQEKSSFKDTEDGRRQSTIAARNLAYEMDAIAKLTGKSREAQMEEMKKQQVDGRIEAKMRLLSANKSEEEIAKIKTEYSKGLAQAQANGTTQMYKEFFATGTYNTEQAATQSALMGKQSRAMEEQIRAMQSGDTIGAAAAREKVNQEALANANNKTLLNAATFGDSIGSVGTITKTMVETTDGMYHSVKKIADANGILLKTQEDYAKALKLALEDLRMAQTGRRREIGADGKPIGPYKDVGGTSAAGAAAESLAQGGRAAAGTLGEAIAKRGKVGEEMRALSNTYNPADLAKWADGSKKADEPSRTDLGNTTPAQRKADVDDRGGGAGQIARVLGSATSIVAGAVKAIYVEGTNILNGGRATGSLGMTGKLIEDFGAGTLTMLHGKEGVITHDQLIQLVTNMRTESVAATVGALKASVEKTGNINLDQMPKGVKTNVTDLPKVDLNNLKLPGFAEQIKANASNVAQEVKKTTPQTDSPKPEAATKKTATETPAMTKDANLNDVVKSLDSLNKQMGTLIAQNEDIGNKQISATRSKSSNIYERT